MATLNKAQIQTIAIAAGLSQPGLMAAVAMAESSGRTDVVNSIGCVGLWQINQPVWVKSRPTWTKAWLKNPVNNARAAKVIYGLQGLQAWEAYTNGAYKKYMGTYTQGSDFEILDPLDILPGDEDAAAASLDPTGTLDAAGTAVDFAAKAGNWISNPANWIRIAYAMGGVTLAITGLAVIASNTRAGQAAGSVVKTAVGTASKVKGPS